MAMVLGIAQANNFKSAMTYEILLMVVLGGIGSISGSVIGATLFIAASEWWLRGLDNGAFLGIEAPGIFLQRLPAGGVLRHHYGGGPLLPERHHGGQGTARSV